MKKISGLLLIIAIGVLLSAPSYVLAGRGMENPCAAKNVCNPCAAKNACNPCAAKNACNPCAAKNACNPCAAMNACNPCAGKMKVKSIRDKGQGFSSLDEAISYGEKLWKDPSLGNSKLSCNTCHVDGKTFNKTVILPYPHFVGMPKDVVSLDQMINFCMLNPMMADPLPYGSKEMTALSAYFQNVALKDAEKVVASMKSNPCAAKNACNPCAAKNACNPCAAKNACNPCAAKNACNPCAANPCAGK